ncbi:CHAD domain-containing protein [Bremerella alba]|nr:CHAD domain-containing protein [Bremerella alba]
MNSDEPVPHAIRRIAREEIDAAIDAIDNSKIDAHQTVHQVRKRCKKIRGLIRLFRPHLQDTYEVENVWYRNAARRLSYVRDAQSLIETYDLLMDHYEEEVDRQSFGPIRRKLTLRLNKIADDEAGLQHRLTKFRARMEEGRERIPYWQLDNLEPQDLVDGLTKTYGRACEAAITVYKKPSSERFHDWRKRVKYHWYHMRIVRPVWEREATTRGKDSDVLAGLLGDDHDLAIFRETLQKEPDEFSGQETVDILCKLSKLQQQELRAQAKPLGLRLFAESPKKFSKRFGAYFKAWQTDRCDQPEEELVAA